MPVSDDIEQRRGYWLRTVIVWVRARFAIITMVGSCSVKKLGPVVMACVDGFLRAKVFESAAPGLIRTQNSQTWPLAAEPCRVNRTELHCSHRIALSHNKRPRQFAGRSIVGSRPWRCKKYW